MHYRWAGLIAACGGATIASAADLAPTPAPGGPLGSPDAFYSYYLHVGPAALIFNAGARIATPLGRIPGATVSIAPQVTAAAELGYRFTPNWAASLTVGVPPTASIDGAGSVAGVGRFGSVVYGPIALTGHYHFTTFGAFQPYIGGGPVYLLAFNSRDSAITDLQVRSALGGVVQVGADYMLTQRLGLYIDLKKAFISTKATGSLGPTPLRSNIDLDAYAVSGGLAYRF